MEKKTHFFLSVLIVLLLFLTPGAAAETLFSIAVTDFEIVSTDPELKGLGAPLARSLAGELFFLPELEIVERHRLDAALEEYGLGEAGMLDTEEGKEIGKFVGADFVITGDLIDQVSDYRLNYRIIDVEKAILVGAGTVRGEDIFDEILPELVARLEEELLSFDLEGRVVDEAGNPLPDVLIEFSDDYSPVRTDSEGYFVKEKLLGEVEVRPEKDGYIFFPEGKLVSRKAEYQEFEGHKRRVDRKEVDIKKAPGEIYLGEEYSFAVDLRVYDQFDKLMDLAPEWELKGDIGYITTFPRGEEIKIWPENIGSGSLLVKLKGEVLKEIPLQVKEAPPRLEKLEIFPEKVEIREGEEVEFQIEARDQFGEEYEVDPRWRVAEELGYFERSEGSRNSFHAENAGWGFVEIEAEGILARAEIRIERAPELVRIDVSETVIEERRGEGQLFKASLKAEGYDQYGEHYEFSPSWKLLEGPGALESETGSKVNFASREGGEVLIEVGNEEYNKNYSIQIPCLEKIKIEPLREEKREEDMEFSVDFKARGYDQYGEPFEFTPSWNLIGEGFLTNRTGTETTYTGSLRAEDIYVEAGWKDVSSRMEVEVPRVLTELVIEAARDSFTLDERLSVNAKPLDQFGDVMEIPVSWEVLKGPAEVRVAGNSGREARVRSSRIGGSVLQAKAGDITVEKEFRARMAFRRGFEVFGYSRTFNQEMGRANLVIPMILNMGMNYRAVPAENWAVDGLLKMEFPLIRGEMDSDGVGLGGEARLTWRFFRVGAGAMKFFWGDDYPEMEAKHWFDAGIVIWDRDKRTSSAPLFFGLNWTTSYHPYEPYRLENEIGFTINWTLW